MSHNNVFAADVIATLQTTNLTEMPKQEEREAAIGSRMIEVKLRFWTDNIASAAGRVVPKHAWDSGMVRMETNEVHGIRAHKPLPFHSILDIGRAVEKVLIAHGIQLHLNKRSQKYLSGPQPARVSEGSSKRSAT